MDTNNPQSGNINDDASLDRPFDQTNGVASGLDGDSDETEEGDTRSSAEREFDDTVTDVGPNPLTGKD